MIGEQLFGDNRVLLTNDVFICSGCGKIIREGDDVFHILGEQFCVKCIENAREVAKKVEIDE